MLDSRGNSLAQSTLSVPSFIGTLPISLKKYLEIFPPESLEPGDVIISNDPWICSGHLPDVTMAMPIFRKDKLIAFAGSIGHAPDMGGRIRSGDSTEIYEEGLQIPPSKLVKAGQWNEDLVNMIKRNVRVPEMVMGDFRAQIAADEQLGRRLLDLVEDQEIENFESLVKTILDTSERTIRKSIREMPQGSYRHEVWLDGFDEPLKIKLRLDIEEDRIICDYAGTSPQINRGLNTVLNYTYAYSAYPLKCAVYPTVPNNEGCFRPFKVTAPEGCLLNPRYPAAVGGRAMVGHYLTTAIFGALQKVIPERIQADSGSPLWCVNFAGSHQGKKYATLFFINGGQGASPHKDGISALPYPSNISNTPAEVIENSMPIMIHKKNLRPDSAGAGKWRGGLGQEVEIELMADSPCTLAFLSERLKFPPQGMNGGKAGQTGKLELNGKWIHPKTNVVIQPHDRLTVWTPGGAGFWEPKERETAFIERDLKNGVISEEAAKAAYGPRASEDG